MTQNDKKRRCLDRKKDKHWINYQRQWIVINSDIAREREEDESAKQMT